MKEEELWQDNWTVEQIVDDMDLFDDDLMSIVFDGNIETTEFLLKIILKRDDIVVISVVGQREFQNLVVGGRSIRFNILAKDSTGKHYDIEVQKKLEGAHVRRARFNSSMILYLQDIFLKEFLGKCPFVMVNQNWRKSIWVLQVRYLNAL